MTEGRINSLRNKITKAKTVTTSDIYEAARNKGKLSNISKEVFTEVVNDFYEEVFNKVATEFYIAKLPSNLGILRIIERSPSVVLDNRGKVFRTTYPKKEDKSIKKYDKTSGSYNFLLFNLYAIRFFKGRFKNNRLYSLYIYPHHYKLIHKLHE